jgi:hypothetical protein
MGPPTTVKVDSDLNKNLESEARADVFDDTEQLYKETRRDSTIGYLGSVEFERKLT